MKRFISRLCGCEETDVVLLVVAPSLTLGGAIALAIGNA